MAQDVSENDLLVEDIKPDLFKCIEESARLSSRSVEEEAAFLLEVERIQEESRLARIFYTLQ